MQTKTRPGDSRFICNTRGSWWRRLKCGFKYFSFSHQVTSPVTDVIKNLSVQLQWVPWVPSSYQLFTPQ